MAELEESTLDDKVQVAKQAEENAATTIQAVTCGKLAFCPSRAWLGVLCCSINLAKGLLWVDTHSYLYCVANKTTQTNTSKPFAIHAHNDSNSP
eukprot:COSAG05_NODE_2724_length_2726_cov_1.567568_4_plen_94_part_00